jgi:hypothetical protein
LLIDVRSQLLDMIVVGELFDCNEIELGLESRLDSKFVLLYEATGLMSVLESGLDSRFIVL